ncbi:MAG: DNA replication/repair protein RecF [Gammaproteobacteria bacterium]|nr:DNA replication/repair protein RecF [Gammaproteobacteria bacterium]
MGVAKVKIERFRCLDSVEFEPDARHNVIVGANGAGKTSILEAIFFLGRGRSFRGGTGSGLIQTGAENLTIFGELVTKDRRSRAGVELSRKGLQIQVDGDRDCTTADLVNALPVQVIDPQIHELVQGGPKGRRSFLDWGVFHVKHEFLPIWRRYRRALQQRNSALRSRQPRSAVQAWDKELIATGRQIDELRREYLDSLTQEFGEMSGELLGLPVAGKYRSGWLQGTEFAAALQESWERDAAHGQTHVGPHRAELALEVDDQPARHRLSRGQQKLLGISLILAQSQFVAKNLDQDVTLLVDEPAAELDSERLLALMNVLSDARAQLFISALDREALPLTGAPRVFHVEHGELSTLV